MLEQSPLMPPFPAPEMLPEEQVQRDLGVLDIQLIAERAGEMARNARLIGHVAFLGMRAENADEKSMKATEKVMGLQRDIEFSNYLKDKTAAYIDGTAESAVRTVTPMTRKERRQDKKVERKLDNLAEARYRNKNAHKYANSQTYGIRPAISQQLRLHEARQSYKSGNITAGEHNSEKLAIRASGSTGTRVNSDKLVAVRGKDQRRTSREVTRRVLTALLAGENGSEDRKVKRLNKQASKIHKYENKADELRHRRTNLLTP